MKNLSDNSELVLLGAELQLVTEPFALGLHLLFPFVLHFLLLLASVALRPHLSHVVTEETLADAELVHLTRGDAKRPLLLVNQPAQLRHLRFVALQMGNLNHSRGFHSFIRLLPP